jgi:hypothetical protein
LEKLGQVVGSLQVQEIHDPTGQLQTQLALRSGMAGSIVAAR